MSGGSYDYLGTTFDLEDLLEGSKRSQLPNMRDDLAALGYAADAADETATLLADLRAFQVRTDATLRRLHPVWHAMEWWKSCDSSEQAVHEALAEYRGAPRHETIGPAPSDVQRLMPDPEVPLCGSCIDAYRNGIEPGGTACEARAQTP